MRIGEGVTMTDGPRAKRRISPVRVCIALAIFCSGLSVFVAGVYLETRNPRSNEEDIFAWQVLAVGTFLLGVGCSLPFVGTWISLAVGLASPFAAFVVAVIVVWTVIILNAMVRFL
jgi:uncharacterized membrane protein YphA (DoxX/SURF4 family)